MSQNAQAAAPMPGPSALSPEIGRWGRVFRRMWYATCLEKRGWETVVSRASRPLGTKERDVMGLLLLIILIILLLGASPAWPYSRSWGYRPVSAVGVLLLILLVLLLMGTIRLDTYPF